MARDVLTVREALDQLSAVLDEFRNGAIEPVAIGSHRRREAVIVPAALWDGIVARRGEAARQAIASVRVEGLEPTEAGKAILGSWIDGVLTHEQALSRVLDHHRVT